MPSIIPLNISLIPSHALLQLPVKTPVKKSIIPLNIFNAPVIILPIAENEFDTYSQIVCHIP